jgi:hypothetical protein
MCIRRSMAKLMVDAVLVLLVRIAIQHSYVAVAYKIL